MIAENYRQINVILRRLLDAESSRRQAILDNSGASAEVRAEVESLLALENHVDDFMSLSVTNFSKGIVENTSKPNKSLTGLKIGNYEIIAELGQGGMGAVYLAKRADGKFEQKAALKMLRREFNVEQIRRYFKRESEIQAKLEHQFIARLLDVGTTADGVPFIVMEYVEGIPVNKFCEENTLSVKDKLKLFNKICQAVAHAHQNLIIHRDLKPSNILVNEKGEPKLLDFGISKLLDAEAAKDKTALTMLGAMTPEYASPEQIRGETVSTATDIYSLGVVLYKMLTANLPYDFKGKTNGEIFKIISENEPSKPSATAHKNPKLKGDLDNIILKALRKEPERRYKTVEDFSNDIWRHLDGLPILARPSTVAYNAEKFLRRNKIPVVAFALIMLSLIVGMIVSLQQAKTARAAQSEAENQSLTAKKEEEKSKKISEFMFKVFNYANPAWYAEGHKTKGQARVLDALDDLSGKIETEFPEQADIKAELHYRFAEVFGRVSSYNTEPARREELFERMKFHTCRALELRRQHYGEWHELVAKDLYFGQHCVGSTIAEHAATLDKAINMMRDTNPGNLNLPYMLSDYANRLALPQQKAVQDIYLQAVTPKTNETKHEIAERFYRESLPIFRHHYKEDNLAIFSVECNLAYVLAVQEKWANFEEHFAVCKGGKTAFESNYANGKLVSPIILIEEVLAEKLPPTGINLLGSEK